MNTLKIELPFSLSEDEAKLLLSVKLYEIGKITLGQAAKLAGFSKQAFIEVIGKYKIPVINYSPEELREELGL
jgi:predicted HTH domain antitoxin